MSLIHSMFRKNYERENNNLECSNYFYRFIGVKDENNYNNILKTLEVKCNQNKNICLIFDNDLPMIGEMELISYVFSELNNMDIYNLSKADITILDSKTDNDKFLSALEYTVNLAMKKESFFNNNVRNNFITKLIVWAYSYIKTIDFTYELNPKCVYYGNIERHNIYFLMMLSKMGFDVVYINPLKEEYFDEIDIDKLSICEKAMGILQIESFKIRVSKGTEIDNIETITKQIQKDIEIELFSGTGMYMPWQFRDGYTKSVLIDGIAEDLISYWNEDAKIRPGFSVKDKVVTIPCFFKKIDGIYKDIMEYQKLVSICTKSANTLFFNSGFISDEARLRDDMYSLMFCQLSDGTFDINEIKKTPMYKFSKYSLEVQDLILNKFNEAISDKLLYTKELDRETRLKLLVLVLTMNEQIVRLIDNFDFTGAIPKIAIFLNNEDIITENILMLLGYLHIVGIDIVIFNPSGMLNINNIINVNVVNINRLQEMNYTANYRKLISLKQGFFSRILNK
ncbi:MAG: YceG family protein [Sarcina sp.]